MTQPQKHQRPWPYWKPDYLEQVPELTPGDPSSGPSIGSDEPKPIPTNLFPTNDCY